MVFHCPEGPAYCHCTAETETCVALSAALALSLWVTQDFVNAIGVGAISLIGRAILRVNSLCLQTWGAWLAWAPIGLAWRVGCAGLVLLRAGNSSCSGASQELGTNSFKTGLCEASCASGCLQERIYLHPASRMAQTHLAHLFPRQLPMPVAETLWPHRWARALPVAWQHAFLFLQISQHQVEPQRVRGDSLLPTALLLQQTKSLSK